MSALTGAEMAMLAEADAIGITLMPSEARRLLAAALNKLPPRGERVAPLDTTPSRSDSERKAGWPPPSP